jgi:hypothetical protein
LPAWRRYNFHIVNLKGTKCSYLPLPLDDVLNFLGVPEDILDFQRYQRGYINAAELVKRFAINSAYEPSMEIVNSVGGFVGVIRDLIGIQTFPDWKDYRLPWDRRLTNALSDIFGAPGSLARYIERGDIKIDEEGQLVLSQRVRDMLNRSWMPLRPYTPDYAAMRRVLSQSVYKETGQGHFKGQPHKGKERAAQAITMQLENAPAPGE